MKTNALYGLGVGLIGAVVTLAQFALGFHSDPAKLSSGLGIMFLGLIPTIALVVLGIRSRRDRTPPEIAFSYAQGLRSGLMIGVVAGAFIFLFHLLYGYAINPGFHDVLMKFQVEATTAAGAPLPPEVDLRKATGPLVFSSRSAQSTIMSCVFISLLAAALIRRRPITTPPVS